mgnify:CR=1 FL=1
MLGVTLKLQEEHITIERLRGSLDWDIIRVEAGGALDNDFVMSQLRLLKDFVISCHFRKEELYIFPLLKRGGSDVMELERRLERDHEEVKRLVSQAESSWVNGDLEGFVSQLRRLSELLKDHQNVENSVAFAYAEMYADDNEKERLLNEMNSIDDEPPCRPESVDAAIGYLYSVIEG